MVGLLLTVVSGTTTFAIATLLSPVMGLNAVSQPNSQWLGGGLVAIPAILLPILSAMRPIRCKPTGVYDAMSIESCTFEIGFVLELLLALVYLGLLSVVLSTVVCNTRLDEKWVGITQGWSSLIALPLLALSPSFVAFPVVALVMRVLRIFTVDVHKGFEPSVAKLHQPDVGEWDADRSTSPPT